MESFFKNLKVERIYQLRYDAREIAKLDIVNWIEGFYNRTLMLLVDRLQNTSEFQVHLHGGVKWCTSNRGRVNFHEVAYVTH